MDEVIPAMPLKYKLLTKIALKLGAIQVEQLKYMESELCFYCKFGSGGHDKKTEHQCRLFSSKIFGLFGEGSFSTSRFLSRKMH